MQTASLCIPEGETMRTLKLAGWREKHQEILPGVWQKKSNYFDLHPLAEVVRGLVYTSVLWSLLAVGVYTIYAMVAGNH
jgi:hypothetical protein